MLLMRIPFNSTGHCTSTKGFNKKKLSTYLYKYTNG